MSSGVSLILDLGTLEIGDNFFVTKIIPFHAMIKLRNRNFGIKK